MTVRRLGFDRATLDGGIVEESDEYLVMRAVIARELVQEYPEGRAYKPAEELEKAAWTVEGRWVATIEHPDTGLIVRRTDVKGRVESPIFAKDITDPKTKRPMVRGIRANIRWFKNRVPKNIIDDVKSGALRDVSIGFTYEEDRTPGEWEGQPYDFVQRNIFIDHVVAPCPVGRCPSPYCGIGVDTILKERTNTSSDCPICAEIERLGLAEASKRLAAAYGEDVVKVLGDEEKVEQGQDPAAMKQPEQPAEEPLPSVEELISRTEELLNIWKRLGERQASIS